MDNSYALNNTDVITNPRLVLNRTLFSENYTKENQSLVSVCESKASSMIKTVYVTNSSGVFPEYYYYDDGQYEGILSKSGSSSVISGSYIPSSKKYVYGTTWHDRHVWEYENFSGLQESPRIFGSDPTYISSQFNKLGSLGLSYRSSWSWAGSSGVTGLTEYYKDNEGYEGILTIMGTQSNGRYYVDTSTQYWDYPACKKGEPQSKIIVYTRTDKVKLEGEVVKPEVDTRVYRQTYSGVVTNKDKIAPIVYPMTVDWTSSNSVPLIIEAKDEGGSKLASIKLYDSSNRLLAESNTSPLLYVYSPTLEGINNFYVYAEDNAGNKSTANSNFQVKIDKTKPSVSFSPNSANWTKETIQVSINVTDTLSGVKSWRYSLSSDGGLTWGSWINGSGSTLSTKISGTGIYKLKVEATDKTNNTVTIISGEYKMDNLAPKISFSPYSSPWTNKNVSVSMVPSDTGGSGVASWQYRVSFNNGGTWGNWNTNLPLSGTTISISSNGNCIIEAQVTDLTGNTTTTRSGIYLIDKVTPFATVSAPNETNSRNIIVKLENITDTQSGVKNITISNYENGMNPVVTNISTEKNISIPFELDKRENPSENYGERKVYVTLTDNAGNTKTYTLTVNYIAQPATPVIKSPINNPVYLLNEKVPVEWDYLGDFDANIPIKKIEVVLKNISSNKSTVYELNGSSKTLYIHNLDKGNYSVIVRAYTINDTYSTSKVEYFRLNTFSSKGNVKTVSITPGSKIRYIGVLTEADIPKGTSIEGKIYYKTYDGGNSINRNISIPFKITNDYYNNIIKLPEPSSKIEIEYFLENNSINDNLTPLLDSIIVFAR